MKWSRNAALGIILIFAMFVYWQLTIGFSTLKWDNIDQFLLFRRFFVDSIRHGILPVWNPTINLGYPFMADPQSGAWYPVLWIFSFFGRYGFQSLNLEWLFHAVMAGWGMYFLGRVLKVSRPVSIIMGMAYLSSGFFVGTAQLLPFLVGATWLPWILGTWVRFKLNPAWKTVTPFILFLGLEISGSYPAFTIILAYFLPISAMLWYIKLYQDAGWKWILIQLKYLVPGLILLLLALSGHLLSILEASAHVGRGGAMEARDVLFIYSFGPECYTSFIAPFASADNFEWFGADPSLINAYVGWAILVAGIIGSFNPNRRMLNVICWVAIISCALLGFSDELPVRRFFHHWVPGFGLFRHPGLFRLYIMACLIILFGANVEWILSRKKLKNALLFTLVLIPFAGLLLMGPLNWEAIRSFILEYPRLPEKTGLSMADRAGLQLLILAVIYGIALFFWRWKRSWLIVLAPLIFIDLFQSVQLNSSSTLYNQLEIGPLESKLNSYDFEVNPPLDQPIAQNSNEKASLGIPLIWRNESMITGKLAADGYNPFQLKRFNALEVSPVWDEYMLRSFIHFESQDSEKDFEWSKFYMDHSRIEFNYSSASEGKIHLMQNPYPIWKAELDGRPVDLEENCFTFCLDASKGEHKVQIFQDKTVYYIRTVISLIGWALILCLYFYFRKRKEITSFEPCRVRPLWAT